MKQKYEHLADESSQEQSHSVSLNQSKLNISMDLFKAKLKQRVKEEYHLCLPKPKPIKLRHSTLSEKAIKGLNIVGDNMKKEYEKQLEAIAPDK